MELRVDLSCNGKRLHFLSEETFFPQVESIDNQPDLFDLNRLFNLGILLSNGLILAIFEYPLNFLGEIF